MQRVRLVFVGILTLAVTSHAVTYTVTSTNDSGAGSLRQAILTANGSVGVADVIAFNIPGVGPFRIAPATPLPGLTSPVFVDGYSQPGSSSNTLATGNNAVLAIVVEDTLLIDTTNSTVRGLAVRQIQIGATTGLNGSNIVQGCFIGLDATGTNTLGSSGSGVFIQTPNNRIGGTNAAARNVIAGHGTTGMEVFEEFATNNLIQGNFIGTDRHGTRAIGNGDRALVVNANAARTTIGGTNAGARNVISGNLDRGITLDGSNNVVQGNFIGTDVTGLLPLGNARSGVEVGGGGNLVGGTNVGSANVIAFNGVGGDGNVTTNGVDVKPGTTAYAILGNSIFSNRGLGIDVNMNSAVTAGHPVLTLASNSLTATVIRGTHTPGVTFRLELFTNPEADPSGFGEGKTLLVSTNIATDAGGNFTVNWPVAIVPGVFVTATANGTSEFSQARLVTAAGRTNSWTNNVSGKWETGGNWVLGVPPFSGHSLVLITNAGSKTVNQDATTATGFPSTLAVSNLTISAPAGATNTLALAHGGIGTPLRVLRSFTLNRGGAVAINNAALSLEGPPSSPSSVDGSITLDGGLLTADNSSQLYIGNSGAGTLNVSNGTVVAYYPIVGANAGANGAWNIAGGSNVVTTVFDLADSLTATGTVRMTGGFLRTPGIYVGLFGNGRLVVSNGTFQCAGQGNIASQPGAQGNFTAAGGTSTFGDLLVGENPGATGSVLVAGSAVVQVNGPLDNRGTVTVAGGSLNVLGQVDSTETNAGLILTGGLFAATNDNLFLRSVILSNATFLGRDVFLGNSRTGFLSMAGGLVAAPGSFNGFMVGVNGGTGVVWQTGGLIDLTNTALNIGGLFSPAIGRMTISNGVTQARNVYVGGQGGGNGTVTVEGGTLIASNLNVNTTSRLILNQGLVQSRTGLVASTAFFTIGDGVNPAEFRLLGGTNAFTAGLRIAANGRITGTGTVLGSVTNLGVISPGLSAGRIDLTGNLILSNSSDLRIELGGYVQSTQYDFVRVTGNATLGGKLSVSLSNNFQSVMTNGANFTNLTVGGTISGAFTNVASGAQLTTTDGYARFTVFYAGGTAVRLTNLQIVDTDGDGLPDWWEDQYGLSKTNAADATIDMDGDGASGLAELRAGTVPTNAASVFRLVRVVRETNNVRLTWNTVGGKSYLVQTNVLGTNGGVSTNFNDLSALITAGGAGESTTNFLHVGGGTNRPAQYYRIRLGP